MIKRMVLVLALLAAGSAGVALAASPATDGAAMSAVVDSVVWESELATAGTVDSRTGQESYPACPQTRNCAGGSNSCKAFPGACQANGPTQSTDTGNEACELSNGSVVRCIFGTIHIFTTQCGQCPCCSSFPACFCPLDCGSRVTVGCA